MQLEIQQLLGVHCFSLHCLLPNFSAKRKCVHAMQSIYGWLLEMHWSKHMYLANSKVIRYQITFILFNSIEVIPWESK